MITIYGYCEYGYRLFLIEEPGGVRVERRPIPYVECTKCPRCNKYSFSVAHRRQNTAYTDDEQNFVNTCLPCFEEIEKEWEEMWDEYWRGRL